MNDLASLGADAPHGATNHHGEHETLWTGTQVTHWFVEPIDGLVFHLASVGDQSKPVLLFAHGFPETWFAWHHQMAALAEDYFCLAFDLKGFGQSSHPTRHEADYDYAFCASEWAALIDHIGLDSFHLVAHDRGVVIADHLCAVQGMADRITSYVRMQQSGNKPHGEPRPPHELFASEDAVALFAEAPIVEIAYGAMPNPSGTPSITHGEVDRRDIDRMTAEIRHQGAAEGMSASFVSAGFDRELNDRMNGLFAAMTMPVLFLQGRFDPGQHPDEYADVANDIPTGVVEFVDAGHFLHLEEPELVSAAIHRWLSTEGSLQGGHP